MSRRRGMFKIHRKQGNGGWTAEDHMRHELHMKKCRKVSAFDRKQRKGGID